MLVAVMLAGCATAYKKSGLTGGYGETKIDSNHYLVYFNGNGYASEDRVWYFWIYRCAQLTKEQGFAYFAVAPVQSSLNKTAYAPEQAGHLYAAVLDGDAQGQAIQVHSSGGGGGFIYIPGGGGVIRTWHSKAIIAMYGNNVPQRTVVLQAQLVLDLLAGYIKTNGSSVAPLRDAIFEQAAYALAPDNRLVNIHQYLLARRSVPFANPYSKAFSPSLNAPPPPAPPPPPPPAPPMPPAAMASTAASPPGLLGADADVAKAQNAATQMGCGVVRANGDATYVAPCGSYDVLIGCDSGKCQPMHTIKTKSDS